MTVTGSEAGKDEIEVYKIALIEVKLNLGCLHPGLYLVGIRQAGGVGHTTPWY